MAAKRRRNCACNKVDARPINADRALNLTERLGDEVKQLKYALEKYTKDPHRYEPQIENAEHAAGAIETLIGGIFRALGHK